MTSLEVQLREEIAQLLQQNWVRAARTILAAMQPVTGGLPRRPEHKEAWEHFDQVLLKSLRKWPCMRESEKMNYLAEADQVLNLLKDLGVLK